MRVLLAAAALLAGCQTAPADPARPETVLVRMSAGSQVMAERACGGPARPESTQQGANTIVYRCVREGS